MFKHLIVIVLLAAFTIQTFQKAVIVVNYYTNTADFAKDCVNKARPMLHCNGHCQLMKKLKQEENKDKQNPERRSENKDEVLFCKQHQSFIQSVAGISVQQYLTLNNNNTKDIPADFFHPPGA
jgi:hypothetical protein